MGATYPDICKQDILCKWNLTYFKFNYHAKKLETQKLFSLAFVRSRATAAVQHGSSVKDAVNIKCSVWSYENTKVRGYG